MNIEKMSALQALLGCLSAASGNFFSGSRKRGLAEKILVAIDVPDCFAILMFKWY